MPKIHLDKFTNFEPVRPERQTEVKFGRSTPIRPAPGAGPTGKDRVDLSGKAAEVSRFAAQINELPEIRAEHVAEARAQIGSGDFNPTANEIVDAILKDEQP